MNRRKARPLNELKAELDHLKFRQSKGVQGLEQRIARLQQRVANHYRRGGAFGMAAWGN
jgi:hypothetical protein